MPNGEMSLKYSVLILIIIFISGCVTVDNAKTDEIAEEVTGEVTDEVTAGVTETEEESKREADIMEEISISSGAFVEGGSIPLEYTCDGSDVSPPLLFKGIPGDAKSIALVMDDPDAPGRTFVHWVIYNIPAGTRQLPKGIPMTAALDDGSLHGMSDFGRTGYGGPCPPSGTHRYYFKLYALDIVLDLPHGASKQQLENAMQGHILAKSELMGRYGR
jgi:hypothetical protein